MPSQQGPHHGLALVPGEAHASFREAWAGASHGITRAQGASATMGPVASSPAMSGSHKRWLWRERGSRPHLAAGREATPVRRHPGSSGIFTEGLRQKSESPVRNPFTDRCSDVTMVYAAIAFDVLRTAFSKDRDGRTIFAANLRIYGSRVGIFVDTGTLLAISPLSRKRPTPTKCSTRIACTSVVDSTRAAARLGRDLLSLRGHDGTLTVKPNAGCEYGCHPTAVPFDRLPDRAIRAPTALVHEILHANQAGRFGRLPGRARHPSSAGEAHINQPARSPHIHSTCLRVCWSPVRVAGQGSQQ